MNFYVVSLTYPKIREHKTNIFATQQTSAEIILGNFSQWIIEIIWWLEAKLNAGAWRLFALFKFVFQGMKKSIFWNSIETKKVYFFAVLIIKLRNLYIINSEKTEENGYKEPTYPPNVNGAKYSYYKSFELFIILKCNGICDVV